MPKLRPERGAKHFLTKFSENPFENEGLLVQGKSPTYQQVTGGGGGRGVEARAGEGSPVQVSEQV